MPGRLFAEIINRQLAAQLAGLLDDRHGVKLPEEQGTLISANTVSVRGQSYALVGSAVGVAAGAQVAVVNAGRPGAAFYALANGTSATLIGGGGGNGGSGGGIGIALTGNTILLFDAGGSLVVEFVATDAGLDAATAAATGARDIVLVPPCAILTANHTLAACIYNFLGATVSGQLTVVSGTIIYNLTQTRTANDANSLVGIVGPTSGIAELISCQITCTQSGSGESVGLRIQAGNVGLMESIITAISVSGAGYAIQRLGAGNGYVYNSVLYGSTLDIFEYAVVARRSQATHITSIGVSETSHVCNVPAGTQIGDILFAHVTLFYHSLGSENPITPPAGWTLIVDQALPAFSGLIATQMATYYHVVSGTEPSDYTWTTANTSRGEIGIEAYSGVDTTNPIDVFAIQQTGGYGAGVNALIAPSVTTTQTNDRLVICAATQGALSSGYALTWSGALAQLWDLALADSPANVDFAADELLTAAGATGTRTVTWTGTDQYGVAAAIALRALAGAGLASHVYVHAVQLGHGAIAGYPLAGDRAVWDALLFPLLHTNDADNSAAALHHTLGTNAHQAAAGNHTHAQLHDPITISDTATVDLSLTGQEISADVIQSALDPVNMSSGTATSGYVPVANGTGGIAWAASSVGNLDGGGPSSTYGGTTAINGGSA